MEFGGGGGRRNVAIGQERGFQHGGPDTGGGCGV